MSHEIEVQANGESSFLEVGFIKTAWHQLGKLLTKAPASMEELFTLAPWLDYPLEKVAGVLRLKAQDGSEYEKVSTKAFSIVRTDTNEELGGVSADYEPIPNRTAFTAALGPMIDQGLIKIETSGVLRDGADAFLLGRFDLERFGPLCREVFAHLGTIPYALVAANHSGRRGNLLQLTPIRVVCANTLGMSEADMSMGGNSREVVIHTGEAELKTVEAAERLFGSIIEKHELIAGHYRALKATPLSQKLFASLVLVPAIGVHPTQRPEFNPDAKLAEMTVNRYERRRDGITQLWTGGIGHEGDESAWEAYNGVVEAIDHNEDLFASRSGVYRLGSLLDGELKEKKAKVLRGLSRYAEADDMSDELLGIVEKAHKDAPLVYAK